jgi:hypothetical protein
MKVEPLKDKKISYATELKPTHWIEPKREEWIFFPVDDVISAIKGLKRDIEKWDKEKIQGVSKKEQAWTYKAIEYFIDIWFPDCIDKE